MRPGLQCSSSSLPRWRSCRLTTFKVLYLSSHLQVLERSESSIFPVTFLLSRKRGWGDLLLQFILYYASFGALTSDQRWISRVAKAGAIWGTIFFSVQVCSVLRSLFLRIGVVYGISNFTNGVGHAEVIYGPYNVQMSISFTGGECSILMQRREDNLSSIVI